MTAARTCAGCSTELPPPKRTSGRQRKWCSERCRRDTTYVRHCEDCGARVSSSDGNGPNAPRWCPPCSIPHAADARRIWTRDAVVLAMQEWAHKYGEPPAECDWNSWRARHTFGDEERALRYERERAAGTCPSFTSAIYVFGSWNAAIAAAGFEPRAAHGGGGNELRRRAA